MSASTRPAVIVFSELVDNESFCAAVVRELSATLDVRPCGPGWPAASLDDVDPTGVRFYLELDAVTGNFVRPTGLERLHVPKLAWLVDTHKKLDFHRRLAADMDLVLYAHRAWGHVFDGPREWLPLHADGLRFTPREATREWDAVFVGSQPWRADALVRIAARHGLRVLVTTTTGPREKSATAELYARARVVFNQHVSNDLNFRVFEAMACGRALLTDAQTNGQYELFEDDRHYVLFKDERDLERQLLRLLGDDALRTRIEREAATTAHAQHTTGARVRQLLDLVDRHFGRVAALATVPAASGLRAPPERAVCLAAAAPPPRLEPPRRFLMIAPDERPTVSLQGYGEGLAAALATRGHEVTTLRAPRATVPAGCAAPRTRVVELEPGPLPEALTEEHRLLMSVGPAHAALDRLVREHGPFDAVIAEGPLAHHLGPSLRRRHGTPLVLALPEHEVARRHDRLTRDQLYLAELEHWACERADLVLVPSGPVAQAARRHYGVDHAAVLPWRPAPALPTSAGDLERFAHRLGLGSDPFVLVLRRGADARADRALSGGPPRVVVADDLGLTLPDGRRAGSRAVRGPALAALLTLAAAVVVEDPTDPRAPDASSLARQVAFGPAQTREDLLATVASAAPGCAPGEATEHAARLEACIERAIERALGDTAARCARAPEEGALVLR